MSTSQQRISEINADQCLELMRRFLTRSTNAIRNPVPGGREISVTGTTFIRALSRCRGLGTIRNGFQLSRMIIEELHRTIAYSPWARANYPASVPRANEAELRNALAQSTTGPVAPVPPMPPAPASASPPAVPPMGPASASPASAPRTSPTGSVASTASTARERISEINADQCLELMRRFLTRTTDTIRNPVPGGRDISPFGSTFTRALRRCRETPNISSNNLITMVVNELRYRTAWSPRARADSRNWPPATVPRGNEALLRDALADSATAPPPPPTPAPRTSPTASVASTASTARERINEISNEQCGILMQRFLTRTTNAIRNPVPGGREISVTGTTFTRALSICYNAQNQANGIARVSQLIALVRAELGRQTAWSPWARANYPASIPRGNEALLRDALADSATAPPPPTPPTPAAATAPATAPVVPAPATADPEIPMALRVVLSIFDRTTQFTVLNPLTGRQISPSMASNSPFNRYYRESSVRNIALPNNTYRELALMVNRELYGIIPYSEWSHRRNPIAAYQRDQYLALRQQIMAHLRAHPVRANNAPPPPPPPVAVAPPPPPPAPPAQPPVVPATETEITPTQAETIAELTELLPHITMEELQTHPGFLTLPPNAQINLRRDWYPADSARGAIPANLLPPGQQPAPAPLAPQPAMGPPQVAEQPQGLRAPRILNLRRANGSWIRTPSRANLPIQLLEAQLIVYYVTTSRNALLVQTALGLCEAINNYVNSIFRNMRSFQDRHDLLGAQLPVVLSVIDFALTRQTERSGALLNALRTYVQRAFTIRNGPAVNFPYFTFPAENENFHATSPSLRTILNNTIFNNPDIITRVRDIYDTMGYRPPWHVFGAPQQQAPQPATGSTRGQAPQQQAPQQGPASVSPQKRSSQKSSSLSAATLAKYATSKCNDLLSVRMSDTDFQEINGAQVPARIPIINESNVSYYNSADGTPLKKFVRKLQKACVKLNTVEDIPLQTIINNVAAMRQKYLSSTGGDHQLHPPSGNNFELKYLYQYYTTNEDTKIIFRKSLNNISVRYRGENSVGIDAGGVRNHFFQSVADQLFPSGLFVPVEEASQYYTFNWDFDLRYFGYVNPPHTPLADRNREEIFKFVGKLVAFLMMNEFKYEGHYTKAIFANLLYKESLSRETNEIFAEDYPLYYLSDAPTDSRSFVTLMNTPEQIEYVGFEFNSDEMRLKPDEELSEEDNQVNARNFPEYFQLFAKHKLINAKALKAFKEGFFITRRFLRGRNFTIEMLDKLTSGGELTPAAIEAIISSRLALTFANDQTPQITKMVAGWMIDILRNTAAILLKDTPNTIFSEQENLNKIKRILHTLSGVKIENIRIHTYGRVAHPNNTTRTQVTYYFNVVDRTDAIEKLLDHTPEQILRAVQTEFPEETSPMLTNPYPLQRLIDSGNDATTLSQSWKAFIPNLLFFWTANRNYSSTKAYTVSYNMNRFGSHTCYNQIDLPNPGRASFGATFDEYYAKMIELVAAAPGFTMG